MTNRVLIYFILVLFVVKMAAIYFTSFSLYGDEAQYWLWSQDLDLGYYSKPPLLAWFIYCYVGFFGDTFISLKTFPIIFYFFISFAVFGLCRSLSFSKNKSLLCAISFLIIPSASLSSFLISTDVVLLLFWTLSMYILLKTRNNPTNYNFILLGLFLGLAFLAKYAALYFLLSLLLMMMFDKKTFTAFQSNKSGSVLFFFSLIIVLAPNIWWNFTNGWATVFHTSDNANLRNLNLNLNEPLRFLGTQILMIGPLLFFFFIFFIKYFRFDFENKFLTIFSLPILIVVLVESFLVRANANWAAPALVSVFVLIFRLVDNKKTSLVVINFFFNYCVALFLFVLILISSNLKIFDRINGFNKFADEILLIVEDKDIAVSDRIIYSGISYYFRNKTNKIFMPHNKNRPVSNHFQMSSPLKSDRKSDFFLIGSLGDVSYLLGDHKGTMVEEFDVLFSSGKIKLYEVSFK